MYKKYIRECHLGLIFKKKEKLSSSLLMVTVLSRLIEKRDTCILSQNTIEFQIITINISCILQYPCLRTSTHFDRQVYPSTLVKSHIILCPQGISLKIINTDTITLTLWWLHVENVFLQWDNTMASSWLPTEINK